MSLKAVGWDDVDWTHLAQNRDQLQDLVNTVMSLQVPRKTGNLLN
jgi:hypothetical protein